MQANAPKLIQFQKIGKPTEGFLSICSETIHLPFDIKRSFWSYQTPVAVTRGRHAHHETEMVLVALKGEIEVRTVCCQGKEAAFHLDDQNTGVYLPKLCWHEMFYSEDAIQLVLCSTLYNEKDYIRDFDEFKRLIGLI